MELLLQALDELDDLLIVLRQVAAAQLACMLSLVGSRARALAPAWCGGMGAARRGRARAARRRARRRAFAAAAPARAPGPSRSRSPFRAAPGGGRTTVGPLGATGPQAL